MKNGTAITRPAIRAIRRWAHSHQKSVLNCGSVIPRWTLCASGIARYRSNAAVQSASLRGGRTPLTGSHTEIERPLSVSLVMPPMIRVRITHTALATSQITRLRAFACARRSACPPVATEAGPGIA
jgi:hypothetical protein